MRFVAAEKAAAAKKEADLAEAIEKWDRDCQELRLVDSRCELKDPFRLAAFKCILTSNVANMVNNHLDYKVGLFQWL